MTPQGVFFYASRPPVVNSQSGTKDLPLGRICPILKKSTKAIHSNDPQTTRFKSDRTFFE